MNHPDPIRRDYALRDGTISVLHFGRLSNPLKLVFCHANGFNAQSYAELLTPLGIHIAAIDMRGHGQSQLPTTPESLPNWYVFADDITAFFERYIDRPVMLAGHSFGAVSAILAASDLGDKCTGLLAFDPVIMPPMLGRMARLRPVRSWMKKNMQIAARAGRRRNVFDSFDAAFDSYQGRGAFTGMSDQVLRDYLAGGLSTIDDSNRADGGVQLSCDPAWEQAIFCAQGHDSFRAMRALPHHRQIIFAGKNSPTPAAVQRRVAKILGADNVRSDDSLNHLFPLYNPDVARDALSVMLRQITLGR